MMMNNVMALLQQFKTNPMQFLVQRRLNIPQNVPMNDPQAILNYLASSGQISQSQIDRAYQMAAQFRR